MSVNQISVDNTSAMTTLVRALALVFISLLAASAASGAAPCRSDPAACMGQFHKDLVDTDKYWFGSAFSTNCPPVAYGQPATECINPDPQFKSVLSRVLQRDDGGLQQVADTVSLATLTFTAPSTDYFACGHEFHFPAITDFYVDPTQIVTIDQSQAAYQPVVTWPHPPAALYTVLVIDAGYHFSHGLYVNAQSGRQDQWEVVTPYHGPKNGRPVTNPFLFLAVPQPGRLNATAAAAALNAMLLANEFRVNVPSFLQQLGFPADATRGMAASLMNVVGDAYGAKAAQAYSGANYCPLVASQLPALHAALVQARIPAAFNNSSRPHLTSLTVDVQPVFSTEDIKFSSCCSPHDVPRATLLMDPFSSRTELTVQLRNKPRVSLELMERNFGYSQDRTKYTLMLVDFADLSATAADPGFVVHWLVVNILNREVGTGQEAVPYFPSTPFTPNVPRMYTFLLFEQTRDIDTAGLNMFVHGVCATFPQGCVYSVSRLLAAWGLADIRGATWYTAEQDAFARMNIYQTFKVRDKATVCAGVPGFAQPCPVCRCPAPHNVTVPVVG